MPNIVIKDMISAFLMGGFIVAGVKFLATEASPAVAAVFGAIPIGMISSNFITSSRVKNYTFNYVIVSLILLVASIIYYILLNKFDMNRYVSFTIALLVWTVLAFGRLYMNNEF